MAASSAAGGLTTWGPYPGGDRGVDCGGHHRPAWGGRGRSLSEIGGRIHREMQVERTSKDRLTRY